MIHGLEDNCSEINFIIKNLDKVKLNHLTNKLQDSIISMKIRSLSDRSEAFFELKGKNRVIFLIISFGEPIPYVSFTVNCLIKRKDQIDFFISDPNSKDKLKQLIQYDFQNQNLRLIGDFKKHQTQYEIRICYHKLVRDFIGIVENFSGWKLKEKLYIRLYDPDQTNDEVCGICLENASKKHCFHLDCQHLFHVDCLAESMMEVNSTADSCPVCRKEILSYDYSSNRFKNWKGLFPLRETN